VNLDIDLRKGKFELAEIRSKLPAKEALPTKPIRVVPTITARRALCATILGPRSLPDGSFCLHPE